MFSRFKNWLVKLFFRAVRFFAYRHDLPAEQFRKGMEFFTSFLGVPKKLKFESLKIGDLEAEWFIPDNITNKRVILYLHGGGYGMGSIKSHRSIAGRIALEAGSSMLIINYRLAPEFTFPAPVEDAVKAYNFLLLTGFSPQNIVIGGDSAGGGLTLALLLQLRNHGMDMPLTAFCMSPWTDLEASHHLMPEKAKEDPFIDIKSITIWGKKYAENELRNPLASPIYADLTGLCPLLIQVGTSEVLYYDSVKLAEHCKRDGVQHRLEIFEGMVHVFQAFAGFLPQSNQAMKNIANFIEEMADKKTCEEEVTFKQ